MTDFRIIDITDHYGAVVEPSWFVKAESVHRQLRPHIQPDYSAKLKSMFAGGARMMACIEHDALLGVAVYRKYETTFDELRFYVDDLVTDEAHRSRGVGKLMLDALRRRAIEQGCDNFTLESGTQRQQTHRFYSREGMVITSFSFRQQLKVK